MERNEEEEARLFSVDPTDRSQWAQIKKTLKETKEQKKALFYCHVKHWMKLSRETVESTSVEIFKTQLDVVSNVL